MDYVWSPILIGDNKQKYSSQQPWIHGTSLMWALHVWSCVTDFSSLTALLGYLVTCKISAHSPSPDGRYQIICNFVRTCYEPLDYANLIFDRCVAARLCQQTRFIVPVESACANRVPIVPEDSGSHTPWIWVMVQNLFQTTTIYVYIAKRGKCFKFPFRMHCDFDKTLWSLCCTNLILSYTL